MFKTVKGKFILFSVIFITIFVGVPMHFLVNQYRDNFDQRSRVMLNTTLDIFSIILDDCMMMGEKNVDNVVKRISQVENIHHIRIFDETGIIKYSTSTVEINKKINDIDPYHQGEGYTEINGRIIQLLSDGRGYSAFQPITNKKTCQGCHGPQQTIGYIDIDAHLTTAEINFFTGSVHFIFLGVAALFILTFSLYHLFNVYINKPLLSFVKAFNKVGEGKLSTRIGVNRSDEFGIMENRFNEMVGNLQQTLLKLDEMHFDELQRADRLVELGELAAEMAHEINNPAGVILTRADYLRINSKKHEDLKKYSVDFEAIVKNITKISDITGNILKYSRKLSKEFTKIDLVKAANEAVQMIQPIITKKKIQFEFRSNIPKIFIHGNLLQINQMITNLLINAIDATKENDRITISISSANGTAKIIISDTGRGIDESELPRIFDPFYTTKPADKGTGLGLYIIKNICKNHEAKISCESIINEGTTFSILFNKTGDLT